MKKIFVILLLSTVTVLGQFKDSKDNELDIAGSILRPASPSFLFGLIDPGKLSVNHSVSLSYGASGNNGMALSVYTNTINYDFSNKLNLEVETSMVNSPYNSFGDDFTSQINGIYLSKARLNYSPSENTRITIQYNNSPFGYGRYGYNGYRGYNRGYRNGFFDWD
ncbi:MAG: hypothetical protein K9J12_18430 [Melioribacteraceae bacterium]|nr:hypothetical protein [Melioribacteraceae bacterium]MCF8266350.1 hypothetical protein [Melioribacteraceae bacterium]MCF8431945.1 hypothetical protein [Melioribacteraceae bacterium]